MVTHFSKNDAKACAEALTLLEQGFTEDPVLESVGVAADARGTFFWCLGNLTLASATEDDDLLLISGKGTALWLKEPAVKIGMLQFLWGGGGRILFRIMPFRLWTWFMALGTGMDQHRDAFARERGEYYYLHFIAVLPEARGQGIAGQLIEPVTSKADAEGKWCYLEANNLKAARAYERAGFRHRGEWRVRPDVAPFYSMERPPKPVSS